MTFFPMLRGQQGHAPPALEGEAPRGPPLAWVRAVSMKRNMSLALLPSTGPFILHVSDLRVRVGVRLRVDEIPVLVHVPRTLKSLHNPVQRNLPRRNKNSPLPPKPPSRRAQNRHADGQHRCRSRLGHCGSTGTGFGDLAGLNGTRIAVSQPENSVILRVITSDLDPPHIAGVILYAIIGRG